LCTGNDWPDFDNGEALSKRIGYGIGSALDDVLGLSDKLSDAMLRHDATVS
jgi:hypothetical protein